MDDPGAQRSVALEFVAFRHVLIPDGLFRIRCMISFAGAIALKIRKDVGVSLLNLMCFWKTREKRELSLSLIDTRLTPDVPRGGGAVVR
jgi:hypothetical protein